MPNYDTKAIVAIAVSIFLAIAGVIAVYAPEWMTTPQKDAITTLISVVTPAVVVVIGWIHHTKTTAHAAVTVANTAATGRPFTPPIPPTPPPVQ